jgi:ABC-2 type transport system ATP-binding protein
MNPVISMRNVSKSYGRQLALCDVSLDVPGGVIFALLGENGAGKSTAIKILLGMIQADAGRCEVLGCDSARNGLEIRRRVGYVPERLTLYEWMTVEEIGWFAAGFYDAGYVPNYLDHARKFGLPANRKIKALSKGMRSKVALSLAMAHQPELLILDEPTSGLDTMVRREFLESMVTLAEKGRTVLLSSHQIGEVERVADIVAIVHGGNLLVVERLDELKDTTRELTITLAAEASEFDFAQGAFPELNRRVVWREQKGRQCRMIVRDVEDDAIGMITSEQGVAHVELRTPNLEEIFLAYMRKNGGGPLPQSEPETAIP